jgi:hypothetical protein
MGDTRCEQKEAFDSQYPSAVRKMGKSDATPHSVLVAHAGAVSLRLKMNGTTG